MIYPGNEPYGVIALDDGDFRPHRRHELSLSLIFTFLLSEHLRFYFPMRDEVSNDVDRAFDQVLRYLPMESKGIDYGKDLREDKHTCLLEGAILVVTSDLQIQQMMNACSSPNIFLDFKKNHPPIIRWRYLENLEDNILKQQIVVYSELINRVSCIFHDRSCLGADQARRLTNILGDSLSEKSYENIKAS
jgi:hypothetical protein